jgi:hypothetical protein
MTRATFGAAVAPLVLALAAATPAGAQDLQQKLAAAKQTVLVLKFPGYVKPSDSLALTFDTAVKSLRHVDVATYLDTPESPVTAMQSLPAGTRYAGGIALGMPASEIEVRITNSNYQKLAP